jgi:phosphoenolpyruvate-protein kinase (PTS system EI component)
VPPGVHSSAASHQPGVRVLREYPDLLEAQLRAVLEVSQQFRIGVLIPMVTTESDVVHVTERLHQLAAGMGVHQLPRIGAMIETPAAALSIPSLKKHVDFFSIGSNDLTHGFRRLVAHIHFAFL